MTEKKRLSEIDIVKALAIIFVVMGHSGSPITHFIYLFHVAVFIMSSGLFFKDSSSESLKTLCCYILKKMKQLLIPYMVWNLVFLLLNNIFIHLNIYTDNPKVMSYAVGTQTKIHTYWNISDFVLNIKGGGIGTQIGGALWFLIILLFVSVGYGISDFVIRKLFKHKTEIIQCIWSMLLLMTGYILGLKHISLFGMAKSASAYWLFHAGVIMGRNRQRFENLITKKYILPCLCSFSILIVLNQFVDISLSNNSYGNPIYFIMASCAGWSFLYCVAKLIRQFKIGRILEYIGKHTMSILILHFLAFKFVAFMIVVIHNLPLFCIASFPNLYGNRGLWWLVYTVIGITIPLTYDYLSTYISGKCRLMRNAPRLKKQ